MASGVEVLGRVLVLGGVTATDMSAHQAEAQMQPSVPNCQTFLTAISTGCDLVDLIDMDTSLTHGNLPSGYLGRLDGQMNLKTLPGSKFCLLLRILPYRLQKFTLEVQVLKGIFVFIITSKFQIILSFD